LRATLKILLASLAMVFGPPAWAVDTDHTWDWEQPHRWYMAVDVHLPVKMWFNAEFNTDVRVVAFQVRSVVDCAPGVPEIRDIYEVACTLEDVALVAAAHPGDAGLLLPVLQELDGVLTGAELQLQVGADGRLRNVDLEGVRRSNRRLSERTENLRLMLARMVAGLDLRLPRPRTTEGDMWIQRRDTVLDTPSARGTAGGIEVVHRATMRGDGTLGIETAGRALLMPADIEGNLYDTRYEAKAIFAPGIGLNYRRWTTVGTPTASSLIALGARGIDYLQKGEMQRLGPEEGHSVGETREVNPPEVTQTALQNWVSLGEGAR
jgi:hypothetical protein